MKSWILLVVAGLLMITTLTGCARKSEDEIQEEFLDYLSIVPFNDFTVLYDKKVKSITSFSNINVWNYSFL